MKDTSSISGGIIYCGVVIIIIPVTIVFEVVMKNLGQLPTESELLRMVREVSSTWVVLADLQRGVDYYHYHYWWSERWWLLLLLLLMVREVRGFADFIEDYFSSSFLKVSECFQMFPSRLARTRSTTQSSSTSSYRWPLQGVGCHLFFQLRERLYLSLSDDQ